MPFLRVRRRSDQPKEMDSRARWGVVLVAVAYSILWQNSFWTRPLPPWRLAASVALLLFAVVLSCAGARSLGRQLGIDAGLNADHELVTSGPYKFVPHPIYTSMFRLGATGFMVTPLPILLLSTVVFMIGTEFHVRIEDRLLASHFGEQFRDYQRRVPAYIPFTK